MKFEDRIRQNETGEDLSPYDPENDGYGPEFRARSARRKRATWAVSLGLVALSGIVIYLATARNSSANEVPKNQNTRAREYYSPLANPANGSMTVAVSRGAQGQLLLSIRDIFLASNDPQTASLFQGQSIEVVGRFVTDKKERSATRRQLYGIFVTCCLADARPIFVTMELGKTPARFKEMTWVKAHGIISFPTENGVRTPLLETTRIEETAAPE